MDTHPSHTAAATIAALHQAAKNQKLPLGELLKAAEALTRGGAATSAADLYKTWIAYNEGDPTQHLACFNHAVLLRDLGDAAGAIQVLQLALKIDPSFAAAHINLGRELEDAGLIGRAIAQWQSLINMTEEITPERIGHRLMALQHRGRVLENADMLKEAEETLWHAIELAPHRPEAAQHWIGLRQQQCKWPVIASSAHVTERQLIDALSPMTLGCFADDPIFQMAKAYRYQKSLVGKPDISGFQRKAVRARTGGGERLRVGYLSSDLREHAVGFALCEVLELHDKERIEVFAYYCGEPRRNDRTHDRIRAAVDTWRDITSLSDRAAAEQIVADEIDILIDVNGYTKQARAAVFAFRPAPVIVNFCGYPGTTASPYHNYLITDPVIVPPQSELYYTEKILHIACEQPIDRKREIAERPSRGDVGLPEDAFVFACFNGMQKITCECFARWMEILKATPGSILWLLAAGADVNAHLRKLAEDAGVAPERLQFAEKMPNPRHLARIGLADLFLDTFPYGAHSTAADAITMGLPVLTVPGRSFPARFCASIVAAAGTPEMICDTAEDYVTKAISFWKDRQSLDGVRASLAAQRETCVLRDMPGLARRLEDLYWQIQETAERGATPEPDLTNLDVYYEIGAEMLLSAPAFEDDAAYRQRYRNKLVHWNQYEKLAYDNRLWPASGQQLAAE